MKRQLSQIIRELEQAEARLERLAENVSDERWGTRNDPARWSVAECVAHLNLTSEAYIPRLRAAVDEAAGMPEARGPYKRDFLGLMFGALVGPLPQWGRYKPGRVKTPPAFVATGEQPKNVTLAEFKRLQLELVDIISSADGLAIDKVKIRSPFGEKISYNCYSALVLLPRHQRRHLQQAELVWGPQMHG